MQNIFSKKYTVTIIAVIILIVLATWYFKEKEESPYVTIVVQKENLIQEVSTVGVVEPEEFVSLAFEYGGKISGVYIDVGDNVFAGQELVRQDSSIEYAAHLQAQADLSSAQATLDGLKIGIRPEEIAVQEAKVSNARQVLVDAKKDVINKAIDAFTKSDDAVRGKADQLFDNPQSTNPNFKSTIISASLKAKVEFERFNSEGILDSWGIFVASMNEEGGIDFIIEESQKNLSSIKTFLDDLSIAVNKLSPSTSLSQTTIDGYKTDISTARTNINIAIVNFSASEEGFNNATASLFVEEKELSLKQSGSTPQVIAAQEAVVLSMEAKLQNASATLTKKVLFAPIGGIVTLQEAKKGEIVSANETIVSIISPSRFEIKVNIPEVDIPKVKIGDQSVLTLDAYGADDTFFAEVYTIDPAETVIEGVPTYKVVLQIIDGTEGIRSGMTADINILTEELENVLAVPSRAVERRAGKKIIKILNKNKEVEERIIETGLRGSDGRVEIKAGLNEGEEVIVFVNK